MNTQIIYATMTGHSKKLANAISKNLSIPAHNITENPDLQDCALLFIVTGVYGGQSKLELVQYISKLKDKNIKEVCVITSSTRNNENKMLYDALCENGLKVTKETFNCIGGFLFLKMGHPNKSEIQQAVEFAKLQIEKIQ